MHAYIYMRVCIYMYICSVCNAYMYVCIYVCMYVYMYMCPGFTDHSSFFNKSIYYSQLL